MYRIICVSLILLSLVYCAQKNTAFFQVSHELLDSTPMIIMKRTACYGTCPQYEISIYHNGIIRYDGKAFVDKLDCSEAILHDNVLLAIQSRLADINFFDFKDEYISPITDIPSVIFQVNLRQGSHKVTDRLSGPKSLKKLHSFIDSIADNVNEWDACKNLH